VACAFVLLGACVQASQNYAFSPAAGGPGPWRGSVQIERIEGDQRLFALRFDDLPPPEAWGPDQREFLVWLLDREGRTVKLGPLRYDRARRTGDLLGAVGGLTFSAFTVKVTAERDTKASVPGPKVLSEREVRNQ
jgi:hypothetical protein